MKGQALRWSFVTQKFWLTTGRFYMMRKIIKKLFNPFHGQVIFKISCRRILGRNTRQRVLFGYVCTKFIEVHARFDPCNVSLNCESLPV